MTLTKRLLVATGISLLLTEAILGLYAWNDSLEDTQKTLHRESESVYNFLMSVRRVYQKQFLASGVPLNDKTVGFLPAHSLPLISKEFSENWDRRGVTISTVSDHPRNPTNQANPDELKVMKWFRENDEEKIFTTELVDESGNKSFLYARPIWVVNSCLKCHGERADAPRTIQTRYDKAYGYQVGDLRGLVTIRIPSSAVTKEITSHYINKSSILFIAFFFLMLLLYGLIYYFMKRPILHAVNLINKADGSDPDWVLPPLPGELEEIGSSFTRLMDRNRDFIESINQKKEQIRQQQVSTNAITGAVQDGILIVDRNGIISQINDTLLKWVGGESSKWVGQSMDQIFQSAPTKMDDQITEHIQSLYHRDSDAFWDLLNDVPIPLFLITQSNDIFWNNPAAEQRFGGGENRLTGSSFDQFIPEENRAERHQQRSRFFSDPDHISLEKNRRVRICFGDECLPMQQSCTMVTVDSHPYVFVALNIPVVDPDLSLLQMTSYGRVFTDDWQSSYQRLSSVDGKGMPVEVSATLLFNESDDESGYRSANGAVLILKDARNQYSQQRQSNIARYYVRHAEKSGLLEWNNRFSVGNPELDKQHKRLLAIIDQVTDAADRQDLLQSLLDLNRYASDHFSYEETLLERCGYENIEEHAGLHEEFIAQIGVFLSNQNLKKEELLSFLNHWWINHILVEDMAYKECL